MNAAYKAGLEWGMEKAAMEKDAIFGFGKKKEPFQPKFKGHSAAIGELEKKHSKSRPEIGLTDKKKFDPMTQTLKTKDRGVTLNTPGKPAVRPAMNPKLKLKAAA